MKGLIDPKDEIELIDEHNGLYARIRVREGSGKASMFITPDQLEEFGRECLTLAENMKGRR